MLSAYDLLGKYIWDAMEYSAQAINQPQKYVKHIYMLQLSGICVVLHLNSLESKFKFI